MCAVCKHTFLVSITYKVYCVSLEAVLTQFYNQGFTISVNPNKC